MGHPALDAYFRKTAAFLQKLSDYYAFVDQGHMRDAQLEQLQTWNHDLYEDILPEHYDTSYGNPDYADKLCWVSQWVRCCVFYMRNCGV